MRSSNFTPAHDGGVGLQWHFVRRTLPQHIRIMQRSHCSGSPLRDPQRGLQQLHEVLGPGEPRPLPRPPAPPPRHPRRPGSSPPLIHSNTQLNKGETIYSKYSAQKKLFLLAPPWSFQRFNIFPRPGGGVVRSVQNQFSSVLGKQHSSKYQQNMFRIQLLAPGSSPLCLNSGHCSGSGDAVKLICIYFTINAILLVAAGTGIINLQHKNITVCHISGVNCFDHILKCEN